ncbi:16S rRNA (cytidine(1402)-2'-O)-methyltransferase [Sphingomonas humi]|uniref:Ribosomal RNA small subunit methyltransferase I n=1 Tax=Sphingomonas humi TaxID=335630 RepID=A0ABP7S1Z8_9SPHN
MNQPPPPGLYIVATPIGNLGDLTARAADLLRSADLVLAEDKRVSAKLLSHVGASVPMRTYNDHSDTADREAVIARLGSEVVALVSDAGTPLISDPGYKLVREARAAGHHVVTLPGPCAAIAAMTLAGLPTDRFLFLGFLPPKEKARAEAIAEVAAVRATLVLYESGPRLGAALASLANGLGQREAAVARELTKMHEECVTGTLSELAERYADAPPRGEIVIVVGPPAPAAEPTAKDLDEALKAALAAGESPSRAAAAVAQDLGIRRKLAYERALELGR